MSASKAIKAVTEKLLLLLATHTPTAKPPDKAGTSPLNIFLYHVAINAAWRNQDLPISSKGQPKRPLLPLNLYYLISAGEEDQKEAHDKLGQAMLKFHDNAELTGFNASSGIKNQTDPLRITLQPLSLDEMSKLWSAFQTPYRPSIAYEVGVVLIESDVPETSPMPVTRRGEKGTGWDVSAEFPATLAYVQFKTPNQPGMRLGEQVRFFGQNLNQLGNVRVAFRQPLLREALLVTPDRQNDGEITVTIPNDVDHWPAGIYTVCIQNSVVTDGIKHDYSSNSIPIALLPEIIVPVGGSLAAIHAGDSRSLQFRCQPKLQVGQSVRLLIGSVQLDSIDITDPLQPIAEWRKSSMTFPVGETPFARLRVDGVDSYDPSNLGAGFDQRFAVKGLP